MAHKNKSNWSAYNANKANNETRANKPSPSIAPHRGFKKKPTEIFTASEIEQRLMDIFYNHEMTWVTKPQISLFAKYYQLLMKAQVHNNFTRLFKLRDIAIKHFIDSMMITRLTPLSYPLMDIGTGPGLPGIVLKIINPHEKIFLAEGVQKRVEFLKHVRDELGLEDLQIFGRNIDSTFEYPVQGIITRAVEDMRNTLQNASGCLQVGGLAYFMKGPQADPEIDLVTKELKQSYELISDIAYEIPKTPHKRRLIIYKKLKSITR